MLELVLVYGLDLGIEGSAWGTVLAQTGMGVAMVVAILRRVGCANAGLRPELARRLLSLGKFIFIRTVSLIASFVLAGVVVTRLGDAPLAAHQIAFQLWIFLALVLDAIAIAGQIIVGQELGAARSGRGVRRERAHDLALGRRRRRLRRRPARPRRRDPAGVHVGRRPFSRQCALLWPLFALMQPLNGIVFALDGILIGASDGRYLALSMAARVRSPAPPCSPCRGGPAGACAASGSRSSSSSSRGSG